MNTLKNQASIVKNVLLNNPCMNNITGTLNRYNNINMLLTPFSRNIYLYNMLNKNHYQSLGVTSNATQSDIKTAYYKLSMQYHPDKNKGCDEAAKKFHDIAEAYEILGNFKLRKLYDKGILHTVLPHHRSTTETHHEVVEDDAQTKFYKQHMKRSERPHASGRTPIYDYDEWTKQHYGQSFNRKQAAYAGYRRIREQNITSSNDIKKETILGFVLVILFTIAFCCVDPRKELDNPKKRT